MQLPKFDELNKTLCIFVASWQCPLMILWSVQCWLEIMA